MARRMRALDLSTRAPDRLSWIAELSRMWDLRIGEKLRELGYLG
jgi:hypothetical protein